jgi:uncharacterized protein HemX
MGRALEWPAKEPRMNSEPDEAIRQLQHEKNVWRGIAIGLAATLVLLIALVGVAALFFGIRSRQEAARAEVAMVEAAQQRLQAEAQQEDARLPVGEQNEPITRPQAIKIAEAHLKVKGQHKADAEPQDDGGWRVTIRRVPAKPGGFTTVVIDKDGRVARIEPGE